MSNLIRVAGYCRTSGEGQRDNTSIPRQREAIEQYCKLNGWSLVRHYVDESRSGSKIEGRDEFQQMMRDAANGKFDAVVVFDITRFARDGFDIIDNARFLKSTFNIFLVDTKNQFDNRKARNALINYVHAGISEQERLSIMDRMIGGRISRARKGEPWSGKNPFGRDYDKETGTWYVTERGKNFKAMMERYVAGERLADIVNEYGFSSPQTAMAAFRKGQPSGTYHASFDCPEIDVVDLRIPIPQIPEVITPALAKKIERRASHNKTYNKEKLGQYLLTGYARCATCGTALTANTTRGIQYYRHHNSGNADKGGTKQCGYRSIRADVIEESVLDYVYRFFMDQPAFDKAVARALPSQEDRKGIEKEATRVERALGKVDKQLQNLIAAIEKGIDPSLLLERQNGIKEERDTLTARLNDLRDQLAAMPDAEATAYHADVLRLQLAIKHKGKDWQALPHDEVREFLRYLFGDNSKDTGHGIRVTKDGDDWRFSIKGEMGLDQELINDSPIIPGTKRIRDQYRQTVQRLLDNAAGTPETINEWKSRPEQPDNHWLDCLVGCAIAASMQGALLFGTDRPSAPTRERVSFKELQRRKRG